MANHLPSNLAVDAPEVVELKEKHPQLQIWTPSSDNFQKLSTLYIKGSSVPRAIVRPQSEDDVSATVAYAAEKSIPVAIRAGGHDYLGRSGPTGALVLDLRDLKSVDIVDDGKAAVIGGGIIAMDLANALVKTGHTTTFGASNTVGHVGWATHGGYGPFSGLFGLGVDQILGARVVDYQGRIFDADDELLYGIRGAGSAFGVIVSLKIKIYKLETVCRRLLTPVNFLLSQLSSNGAVGERSTAGTSFSQWGQWSTSWRNSSKIIKICLTRAPCPTNSASPLEYATSRTLGRPSFVRFCGLQRTQRPVKQH